MSDAGTANAAAQPQPVDLDLTLRSRHVEYLRYVADRDSVPVSHVLCAILNRALERSLVEHVSRKSRVHVVVNALHLAHIDRMALSLGVYRSEVVRQLIDEALAEEPLTLRSKNALSGGGSLAVLRVPA